MDICPANYPLRDKSVAEVTFGCSYTQRNNFRKKMKLGSFPARGVREGMWIRIQIALERSLALSLSPYRETVLERASPYAGRPDFESFSFTHHICKVTVSEAL